MKDYKGTLVEDCDSVSEQERIERIKQEMKDADPESIFGLMHSIMDLANKVKKS